MRKDKEDTPIHFNQEPKRKAEYTKPPNLLKAKVGSGGLSDKILEKAQALLENNSVDFQPLAEMYLGSMIKGIEYANNPDPKENKEAIISAMLYPAMQLKANGGMFHYPLVTSTADRLVQFLEVIEEPDSNAVEIILAFHTSIRAIVLGKIIGNSGRHGEELIAALDEACMRYFEKNPKNKNNAEQNYNTEF